MYLLRRDLSLLVLALGVPASLALFSTGQPTILACAKAGHECREGRHGIWLLLVEVAGEPFVADAGFKGR